MELDFLLLTLVSLVAVYSVAIVGLWVFLLTAKPVFDWLDGKKESPDEA